MSITATLPSQNGDFNFLEDPIQPRTENEDAVIKIATLVRSALSHLRNHEYEAAIGCYDQALAIPDMEPELENIVLDNKTIALRRLQQKRNQGYQEAIATCEEALRNSSLMNSEDIADFLMEKAIAHIELEEFDEAIATCARSPRDISYARRAKLKARKEEAEAKKYLKTDAAETLASLSRTPENSLKRDASNADSASPLKQARGED